MLFRSRQCRNNAFLNSCYIAVLLAGLVSTGHGLFFGGKGCVRDENSKYQSLYCWLSKELKIHIPDVSIRESIFTMVRKSFSKSLDFKFSTQFDSLTQKLLVVMNNNDNDMDFFCGWFVVFDRYGLSRYTHVFHSILIGK